jgi:phosphatidylinositol alpha 1,6-mannosyltransferase
MRVPDPPSGSAPRVALFPDSFLETNGVANTFRHFVSYAEDHRLPVLCVHATGSRLSARTALTPLFDGDTQKTSVRFLPLLRSPLAFRMESDLAFDPFFVRHASRIERALREFRPDVIHISGPSELGIAGAYFAWKLGVPLVASWHTNLHEYAAQRLPRWLRGGRCARAASAGSLEALTRFYRLARLLYAPNVELAADLERQTGRRCLLMPRGVDAELFRPERRRERLQVDVPVLGYVGRLSAEKNVALLPVIDAELRQRGVNAHWLIVGQGEQDVMLRRALGRRATFPGVLRGVDLATAYAGMDLFVFPSATDTFGNVVLEALASGVPAVVTPHGGPAHIVTDGSSGRVVTEAEFASTIVSLLQDEAKRLAMAVRAREEALRWSWETVFDGVCAGYKAMLSEMPMTSSTGSFTLDHATHYRS